jgi:hypothetical protein
MWPASSGKGACSTPHACATSASAPATTSRGLALAAASTKAAIEGLAASLTSRPPCSCRAGTPDSGSCSAADWALAPAAGRCGNSAAGAAAAPGR